LNTKEAYKQKMEAELELAQAKLAEFKAQAKSAAVDQVISKPFTLAEIDETIQSL
jgi:hypothetical protein